LLLFPGYRVLPLLFLTCGDYRNWCSPGYFVVQIHVSIIVSWLIRSKKIFAMDDFTKMVLSRLACEEGRTKEILTKLIIHLHDLVRDVKPTEVEWYKAIDFLTRTGQKCSDKRQEFILLSDVLGISMLVDSINHKDEKNVTETTVTGPFHSKAKMMSMGENIATGPEKERGEPTLVTGLVTDSTGEPIVDALVDVWQSDDIGYYDIQDVNQPDMNLRGVFKTDSVGQFAFKTIKPAAYPVPTDGPVGELLRASGRHAMRPAHIHFMISAEGYERLITHLFVKGDQYIKSDAVFGVKDSLILEFVPQNDTVEAERLGFKIPYYKLRYNFKLKKLNHAQP
jgi:protocatechuate 3,4-dioxygenase beta subunit